MDIRKRRYKYYRKIGLGRISARWWSWIDWLMD